MEIRGTNWNDLNRNGVRDPGEPGLAGMIIYLDLNNNGILDANDISTQTLGDDLATPQTETGQYAFTGLQPGTYTVREIASTKLVPTFPIGGSVNAIGVHTVTIAQEQIVDGIDFGNASIPFSEIRGTKWNDLNGNGVRDGESNLVLGDKPDVVFVLDVSGSANDPFIGTPVGDANGDGRLNTILDAEIAGFQALNQALIDKGLGQSAKVGIVAFAGTAISLDLNAAVGGVQLVTNPTADSNGNGIRDVNELLSSIQIEDPRGAGAGTNFEAALQEAAKTIGTLGTTPGNANVIFLSDGQNERGGSFDDEVTSLLTLGVNQRAFGVGEAASLNQLQSIDPGAQKFTTTDRLLSVFGNQMSGSTTVKEPGLAGVSIYLDANNNGVFDPGERTTITRTDNPATPEDETGQYAFTNLQPGNYTVREIVPDRFLQTFPSSGSHAVTLALGQIRDRLNFGNAPTAINTLLTFEGVGDLNPVGDFYAASGISFSANAVGLVDVDAGGNGNFGSEPSGNTVVAYKSGKSLVLNLNQPTDISSGQLSFLYTSAKENHEVKIYDGLNGTGNLLVSAPLPKTPSFGAPDPNGKFSPFQPFSLNFKGNAKSIVLGSVPKQIGFDDIKLTLEPVISVAPTPLPTPTIGQVITGTTNPDNLVGNAGDDTINGGATGSNNLNFARTDFPVGDRPGGITTNDLDKDGDIDLAVALPGYDASVAGNYNGNSIAVLRNNGDGTFAAPVVSTTGIGPSVTSADLDKDGDIDLFTANAEEDNISVLRNNGDGTFAAPVNFVAGDRPFITATADLDGDGDLDLVTGNTVALDLNTGIDIGDTISVLRNNGDGSFALPETLQVGNGVNSVSAADLDRDGDLDLITGNPAENSISVLRNNGNGTFAAPVKLAVGDRPGVNAADLDRDGDIDLATANFGDASISVLRNNGDGTFAPAVAFATENNPGSLNAADLDGDGDIDLTMQHSAFTTRTGASSGNTFSVLRNNGDGTFAAPESFPVANTPNGFVVANLNGSGNLDIATSNFDGDNVSVYLSTAAVAVGNDTLTGGAGKDSFVFNNPNEGVDTITDFASGTDRIAVKAADFGGGLTPDLLRPNQFALGAAAVDGDDRFIYNPLAGALFFDPDGIGAAAPVQLATLSGAPALSVSDIFVI